MYARAKHLKPFINHGLLKERRSYEIRKFCEMFYSYIADVNGGHSP